MSTSVCIRLDASCVRHHQKRDEARFPRAALSGNLGGLGGSTVFFAQLLLDHQRKLVAPVLAEAGE